RPASPPPPPPDVAAVQAEREKVENELRGRLETLEKQVREARRKAGEAEEEARKARGKGATVQRQLLLTRSELDLFKEKLVWSEKRVVELEKLLFTHDIPLPEREAAPQPKPPPVAPGVLAREEEAHTGGEGVVAEAADYEPEEDPAGPAGEEPPAGPAAP